MPKAKLSFESWMRLVDQALFAMYSVTSDDLDDWKFYADWTNDFTYVQSAKRAWRNFRTGYTRDFA